MDKLIDLVTVNMQTVRIWFFAEIKNVKNTHFFGVVLLIVGNRMG